MAEAVHGGQYRFDFVGGVPCLDFANIVSGDRRTTPAEHLHGYGDLVSWGRQAGLVTPAQARALQCASSAKLAGGKPVIRRTSSLGREPWPEAINPVSQLSMTP